MEPSVQSNLEPSRRRVLVAWGSEHGGTEGIGRTIADALGRHGYEVSALPAGEVKSLEGYGAVIVGGGLYANRWTASARRFVERHVRALRKVPVWLFSSGPLDDSADRAEIPAPSAVAVLAERVGAQGHATFGGRLEPDVKGFPASAMAKKMSGDFRNPERIRAWADELAAAIPEATPGKAVEHPARSIPRLMLHGLAGWVVTAGLLMGLMQVHLRAAIIVHAIAAPIVFGVIAWHYFRARGARNALPTAITWTALVALLDFVLVAGLFPAGIALFARVGAIWIPFVLIFLVTWAIGGMMSTMPWPKPPTKTGEPPRLASKAGAG